MKQVKTPLSDRIVAYLKKRKTPATYAEIAKALRASESGVRGRISEINALSGHPIVGVAKRKCRVTGDYRMGFVFD